MPKLKTNKAAKKRYKITSKGKVLMPQTSRRHLMTDKESGEKRGLRRWVAVDSTDQKRVNPMIPYR